MIRGCIAIVNSIYVNDTENWFTYACLSANQCHSNKSDFRFVCNNTAALKRAKTALDSRGVGNNPLVPVDPELPSNTAAGSFRFLLYLLDHLKV